MFDQTQQSDSELAGEGKSDASDTGVDRTLIRWMLSHSPADRVRLVQNHINALQRVRSAESSE